tara:strand:- start:1304 stop:3157 length:1854 start_codon:yes stop_codon:yes gene_type:complete
MPLQKIPFAAGIVKEGTQYSTGVGWYDCDKVRFRAGRPEKIGGWEKYSSTPIKGIARSLHDWSVTNGNNYLGIGTNLKFYVEIGTTISDITPIRSDVTGEATFGKVADGDATLLVSDTAHGAVLNDFVTFSLAASLGANITPAVLNQEYQVSNVVNADSYHIEAKDTSGAAVVAAAGDTGNGGGSTNAKYQISVGTNAFVSSTGYGTGSYGSGPYGSSTDISSVNQLRLYSQDEFGDDLIFSPRGGAVYQWIESAGTGTRAVNVSTLTGTNAPEACLQVIVSDVDRHVIAFGCNPLGSSVIDPLLVRWSDQEESGEWTPTATNTAGGQVLSVGTGIISAIRTRQETLIFTDTGITSMRFSGAPYVYSFDVLAEKVSIISPKAGVAAGDAVFFMDREGFYIYTGAVTPLPCSVHTYVFDNIQKEQVYKIFATGDPDNNEVTWHYPVGAANAENTNYVTYNYVEDVWSIGTIGRGAWIHGATKAYPVAAGNNALDLDNNYLYTHEKGYDADGAELVAFVESGGIELGDGEHFMFVNRYIADMAYSGFVPNVNIAVTIKGRNWPLAGFTDMYSDVIYDHTQGSDVRVRAREFAVRLESTGLGYGWSMGDFRFRIKPDGKK